MLDAFLTYINEQKLFEKSDKILLAVSGGIDSILLTDLFSKAKFNFGIAHCNFGLRGEESDADELFVKKLATKHKVPFHHTTFDTQAYAAEQKISTQMAARELRYAWFQEVLKTHQYQYIATAQHKNDSIETVLFNLAKGTGIAGMHGILPKRANIIRPLLFAKKDDIYDYVVENQLIWREDSSNESDKYHRNFIRHQIVPLFKELNPNFEESFERSMDRIAAVEQYWYHQFENFKKEHIVLVDEIIYLKIKDFGLQKSFYHQYLSDMGYHYSQIADIETALAQNAIGKQFDTAQYLGSVDRGQLVFVPKNWQAAFGIMNLDISQLQEGQTEIFNEAGLKCTLMPYADGDAIKNSKNVACLDYDLLPAALGLRSTKNGDWFCPLGMNKKKSVADFLNDQKVPTNMKDKTKLLLSANSIAWIVGHRIDNRFKLSAKSTRMLLVEMLPK